MGLCMRVWSATGGILHESVECVCVSKWCNVFVCMLYCFGDKSRVGGGYWAIW